MSGITKILGALTLKSLLLCLAVHWSCNLYSQNFTVNSTIDAVDAVPGDGNCNDGSGNCTLRAAIQESNTLGGPHTITLPAGTYTLSISGANEDLSLTGDLDISGIITINGSSAQTTVVDAGGLDRVMHVHGGGRLIIDAVALTGGFIDRGNGGGLLNEGILTFTNGEIFANSADLIDETLGLAGGFGGGIANYGTADFALVTIRGNDAIGSEGPRGITGGGGGGSTPGFGGGIYNDNGSSITMVNSTLSGNRAMGGRASRGSANGGVWNAPGSTGGNMLPGSGGTAGGGVGGNATGDYSGGGGGGSAGSGGGSGGSGGYGSGGGAVGARSGGGSSANPVGAGGFGGGSGNNACCSSGGGGGAGAGFGGGIFNNGGDITLTNVTIAYNEAMGGNGRSGLGGWAGRGLRGTGLGGGIFNRSGTVNINNTLLSNNNSNSLDGAYLPVAITYQDTWGTFTSSTGYNLIFNSGTATIGGTTTGNVIGTDPLLESLALNGGTTFTHATLDCASPIIDAGLDAVAPATDQIGAVRIDVLGLTNISDIGAFEGPDCVVLPIELSNYIVTRESCAAILKWSTATEQNNDYFIIERSKDMLNWEQIGTVDGAGDSQSTLEYLYRDDSNDENSPIYYRLLQVDFDGDITNVGTRAIQYFCHELVSPVAFPNPMNDWLLIESREEGMVTFLDINGRLIHEQAIHEGETVIDVSALHVGTYIIHYTMKSGRSFNGKLVKL